MDTLAYDAWRRQGSSVVFDAELLAPALHTDALVSLRRALTWVDSACDLPEGGRTVLVGGLDSALNVLGPEAGTEFLHQWIHPLVLRFQHRRSYQGLVFGFKSRPSAFIIDRQGNVFFRVQGGEIPLSRALWAATADVREIRRDDVDETARGYYVGRVS